MAAYEEMGIIDFDHVEFAVSDLEGTARLYETMGFEKCGTREIRERALHSILMGQGEIWILLSRSTRESDPVAQFVERHGSGVFSVAFRCNDAFSAAENAGRKGATVVEPPRAMEKDFGSVQQSVIQACADLRHTFVSRKGALFGEGFDSAVKERPAGVGFTRLHHLAANVERGELKTWIEFYERVFGLKTARTTDSSCSLQSPDGRLTLLASEPGDEAGPIQEFLDVNHGAGIQHIAFQTADLATAMESLKAAGLALLGGPAATNCESVALDPAKSRAFSPNLMGPLSFEFL